MINIHILLFLLFAQNIYTLLINDPLITTSWGNGGGGGRPGRPGRPNRPNQNYTYTCVPVGTCPGGSGIDPRIVTPNQSVCPPGQVPCYSQNQGITQCGVRAVAGISTADGPSSYGAFPWQAYIENQTQFTGSGVLLDQYHVLTAAHKVNFNTNTPQNIRVYMGVWNPSQRYSAQLRTASRIDIHPRFNPTTLVNDIAIITLNQPVQISDVVIPGCLPARQQSFTGQSCVVSGWGQTRFGGADAPTNPQKQVTVRIVDDQTCRTSMSNPGVLGLNANRYLDLDREFCAGGVQNRDSCTQDGGSPLMCLGSNGRYQIAGLVIWGVGCGRPNVYGVYVEVSKYRNWIDRILNGR